MKSNKMTEKNMGLFLSSVYPIREFIFLHTTPKLHPESVLDPLRQTVTDATGSVSKTLCLVVFNTHLIL
jgi:hypothetical protein